MGKETGIMTGAKKKASYTVEASITLPIFIFVCGAILIFFRILAVEWGVSVALNETAREMAVLSAGQAKAAGASEGKEKEKKKAKKEADTVKNSALALARARILTHKTPLSVVRLGALGFDFSESKVDDKDIELVVSYKVPLPARIGRLKEVSLTQRAKAHRWVGFDPSEGKNSQEEGSLVFITESGSAFHRSKSCSYLNPSIRPVAKASVEVLRNSSGHIYYPCPLCGGRGSIVYITTYGENYHTSIACSGLKRTIRSTTEKKAKQQGYHACSKCAK